MIQRGPNKAHAIVRTAAQRMTVAGSTRAVTRDLFIAVPFEEQAALLEELVAIHRQAIKRRWPDDVCHEA
jgi:hypothetical protein